ncbi:hypothetical protein RS584_10630 [Enterobacter sp. DTU_2021_1002640_1_SI_PRY_ASU_LCPMC_013]|uniref:hypothetical protein n=1 Tax=Enterobacter sp. DTU_2021_1002640_1_SI_PRY_ASU_LCPMC_013 TaxID=3077940 RepID=UPI0028E718C9|nr:hypothetical protein [Enterobacter sp. DTU_2021_1002640_1_SI_PRY_ASU_LCPMC_013]WNV02894.1 hypothetical protein RS584_10630 [Enterobacter sp. DTU_2021_1002640_1_SI_PRY_ASU_LCPMC_013]
MKKEIKTLESRQIYRNRWMSLKEDRILRADGSEGLYSVIEKDDFVVIIPVENDEIYLVEQYRYPLGQRTTELPTKALRGHQCGQTLDDNVLNDFESVNFVHSEKLRCGCRHQNPSMVNLRDGHLNLAQNGHYNFAITTLVRIMYIMLNYLW